MAVYNPNDPRDYLAIVKEIERLKDARQLVEIKKYHPVQTSTSLSPTTVARLGRRSIKLFQRFRSMSPHTFLRLENTTSKAIQNISPSDFSTQQKPHLLSVVS